MLYPAKIAAGGAVITPLINSLFTDGLSLEPLIEQKLPWLNLTELIIETGNGYVGAQLTPQFDKHKLNPNQTVFLNLPGSDNETLIIEDSYAQPLLDSVLDMVD